MKIINSTPHADGFYMPAALAKLPFNIFFTLIIAGVARKLLLSH